MLDQEQYCGRIADVRIRAHVRESGHREVIGKLSGRDPGHAAGIYNHVGVEEGVNGRKRINLPPPSQ